MNKDLRNISCSLWSISVTLLFASFMFYMNMKVEIEKFQKEYNSTRTEITEFIQSTKADLYQEHIELKDLIKSIQKVQDGKMITLRRSRGKYIFSVEEKKEDDK